MPNVSEPQYWLLTSGIPTGPFTAAQVHEEIVAGRATWQTPACALGSSTWLPVAQTVGLGPLAATPEPVAADTHTPPQLVAPPASTTATPAKSKQERIAIAVVVGVLLAILTLVGWLVYEVYDWIRPYTPLEVCQKCADAPSATEAKKYVTPRMYPLVDDIFKNQSLDQPNDTFEFTRELEGSPNGIKQVGFRGSTWVAEEGRRARIEGYFRLVQTSGWKVDDVVFTGVEGVVLPGPFSLVDEQHREKLRQTAAPNRPGTPSKVAAKRDLTPPPPQRRGALGVIDGIRNNFGWGGVVVVLVIAVIAIGAWNASKEKRT